MAVVADEGHEFISTKTYDHSVGLSCVFRQWRATDSHCRFLHGYALKVRIEFQATELDYRNWVMDFGGLKALKEWLQHCFDHKTLVAEDDPEWAKFMDLDTQGIIQIITVDHVGCEAFAKLIFDHVQEQCEGEHMLVNSVEVAEHPGNSAIYRRKPGS